MKSHEVLKQVVEGAGTKQVASDLKVSTSLVYKWCADPGDPDDIDASGARNPLDRIMHLCESTADRRPVEWLCQQVGGYFVASPESEPEHPNVEYLNHTQALLGEFSNLLHVISESIANEGRIDNDEAARIRRQWQTLQSHGEAFVRACERGFYDPDRCEIIDYTGGLEDIERGLVTPIRDPD